MTQRPLSPSFWLACLSAAALLSACTPAITDPCEKGSRWSYAKKQCVRDHKFDDDEDPTDTRDASVTPNHGDASIPIEPPEMPTDAGEDGGDANAQPEAGPSPTDPPDAADIFLPDAGQTDASVEDAGLPPGPLCTAEDQAAWGDFHLSGALLSSIASCFEPSCVLGGACPMDECLASTAGVLGCQECVTAEVECMAARCIAACSGSGSEDRCRACACANGCVDAFDSCNGGEALNVCEDCHGLQCGYSLSPALIMVVVRGLLL